MLMTMHPRYFTLGSTCEITICAPSGNFDPGVGTRLGFSSLSLSPFHNPRCIPERDTILVHLLLVTTSGTELLQQRTLISYQQYILGDRICQRKSRANTRFSYLAEIDPFDS